MRDRIDALIARVTRTPVVAGLLAVVARYDAAGGGLLANGLAFATLFAAVPAILLALGLTGFLIHDPGYQSQLLDVLARAFPPLAPLLAELLHAVTSGSGISSGLGLLGLIWAISQFYATLDTAFARLFPGSTERDLLGRTVRGFATVGLLGAIVIGFVVIAWTTSFLDATLPGAFPAVSAIRVVVTSPVALLVLTVFVIGLAYRVLPPRQPTIRVLLLPAVSAGAAVAILTQVFTAIAPRLVGATNVVGSLAAAFASLAWLSFGYQAVLLGAAWVAMRGSPPVAGERRD
jgi:YihY family inner membrane protein